MLAEQDLNGRKLKRSSLFQGCINSQGEEQWRVIS